ncbi:hypothetical protein FEM48_Zijuj04G0081300 [Ziziphus jujuba var. spinosa]|uniref:Uncharacterized protein n=1 Tax=Ziziphus jujuba var. spinosa TaxID=714518 RepID=A0A978VIR4_ZIZJJ|nr:hypothetical protein FEM48_Zijuj04G0081300 [Ziziphus jujuba var. spinosa]
MHSGTYVNRQMEEQAAEKHVQYIFSVEKVLAPFNKLDVLDAEKVLNYILLLRIDGCAFILRVCHCKLKTCRNDNFLYPLWLQFSVVWVLCIFSRLIDFITSCQVRYSCWVLSSLILIDRVHWINKEKLIKFILDCQVKI